MRLEGLSRTCPPPFIARATARSPAVPAITKTPRNTTVRTSAALARSHAGAAHQYNAEADQNHAAPANRAHLLARQQPSEQGDDRVAARGRGLDIAVVGP